MLEEVGKKISSVQYKAIKSKLSSKKGIIFIQDCEEWSRWRTEKCMY